MSGDMRDERDGDLARNVVLSDGALAQLLEDLARPDTAELKDAIASAQAPRNCRAANSSMIRCAFASADTCSVSSVSSGDAGGSYGSSTPVKFFRTPRRAWAYMPF